MRWRLCGLPRVCHSSCPYHILSYLILSTRELFGNGGIVDPFQVPAVMYKVSVQSKILKTGYAATLMGEKDELENNLNGTRLAVAAAGAKKAAQAGELTGTLKGGPGGMGAADGRRPRRVLHASKVPPTHG